MMTERKVTMGPEEARELVQIATKCDFDIDISPLYSRCKIHFGSSGNGFLKGFDYFL